MFKVLNAIFLFIYNYDDLFLIILYVCIFGPYSIYINEYAIFCNAFLFIIYIECLLTVFFKFD